MHRTPAVSTSICAVHDIDLIRWFTGSDVKNVWAIGGVFEFDLYKELNDADNAAATIQMENGAMGFMFTNRTHAAGSNVETEIIGTHGTLRIANVGAKNLLNIVDEHGSREEYYPDFMSRWHEAFVAEMVAFTGHVRDNTKPADLTVYDGTAVSRLLTAARNPLRPARCCRFDKISIEKACHHRWQAFCYPQPCRTAAGEALH